MATTFVVVIVGRWSRSIMWASVGLSRGAAVSLANGMRPSIPKEYEVIVWA